MRILIDPGHGGRDPGAQGNGLIEKDLTMFLALRIEERLDKYDCEAEIFQLPGVTGMEDMQSVVDTANDKKADFFLSLHINSATDPDAAGFESFRYPEEDAKTQNIIHAAVTEYLAEYGIQDRKAKEANFKVLRETKMSAVLLECCFLSSPSDAERLKDIKFLDKLANAITWGLAQSLGLKPRPAENNCETCPKYMKVFSELQAAKQALKQVSGIAAPWMLK
jgi:N-acetylmuramoyl-L-alanine amidase